VGAHHPRARYMSTIVAWWARRPRVDPSDSRTWLVPMIAGMVALAVLVSTLPGRSGSRTVLEPPVLHGGGVAQPLPSEQSSPAEPASTAPSVPADPASSTVVPPLPPQQPPVQPTKPDPPAPAPPPFSALAGFRCPDTANSGFTTRYARNTGWYVVNAGGWTGDGCQGHLVAMPMSGDPNRDDLNNVMLWWFKMPPRPKCAVEVYVPHGPSVRDAAGAPATYFVYGTTDGSGSTIGRFDIDQIPNQGRWVAAGKFPATSGQLSVRLMSRGVSNADNSHLGGSAVRVSC
jgi:hypothetical protein